MTSKDQEQTKDSHVFARNMCRHKYRNKYRFMIRAQERRLEPGTWSLRSIVVQLENISFD